MPESVKQKYPFEFLVREKLQFETLLDCIGLNDVNSMVLEESMENWSLIFMFVVQRVQYPSFFPLNR